MKRRESTAVGTDEPRKPQHSLPSYQEPTPETHRKLTREEEAELALKRTGFTAGVAATLTALFLFTILLVPAIQFGAELRAPRTSAWLPMLDIFRIILPTRRGLPTAEQIKSVQNALETDSVVSRWLLPPLQSVLSRKLGAGNEQVYLGREGWLFYRPDVDYVIGPGFLTPARLRQRAHVAGMQPDAVKAIIHFRDQLAARGIELLVVPVPTKLTVEGEMLAPAVRQGVPLQNASFAEFKTRLETAGVRVFDPAPLLLEGKTVVPLYLRTDTHWRPETMEFVAARLARLIGGNPGTETAVEPKQITALGDLARMLMLPAATPEAIAVRQITSGNSFWRPTREAEVLVLGDSFANIFSLEALGWGESAGLVEHLSHSLGGRALDCIVRNSDGAFATREMLARELARGRDRLAGKKLVVWEFAARELASGNWKLLEMKLGQPSPSQFFSPAPGERVEVTGTVEAVSLVPRPGSAPYKDHIMAVHLTEISIPGREHEKAWQAIVYLPSMRDNVWTSAARLRAGDRISVQLRAWSEVSRQHEGINRTELDDPALQLEEPVWGELDGDAYSPPRKSSALL